MEFPSYSSIHGGGIDILITTSFPIEQISDILIFSKYQEQCKIIPPWEYSRDNKQL